MAQRINSVYAFEDTLIACAVGDHGLLLTSTDGGATWRRKPVPTEEDLYTVLFPGQSETGYACGSHGTLLRSDDEAETWRALDSGTDTDLRHAYR
jgi:photosystem II stability/assembly factor-like uncharacterized protein